MPDAVKIDKVGRGLSGTLTKSGIDIGVVGAEQTGQRLVVRIGVGIDVGLFHQLAQTTIELLILRERLCGLCSKGFKGFFLMVLLLADALIELTVFFC